jgi:hypothetical protein
VPGLRWKSTALAALRHDYEVGASPVNDVAATHATSRGHVMRLAKRHGWKRRQADRLPPEAHANWNTYRNVQRWHGRAVALAVVAGLPAARPTLPQAAAGRAATAYLVAATPSPCPLTLTHTPSLS